MTPRIPLQLFVRIESIANTTGESPGVDRRRASPSLLPRLAPLGEPVEAPDDHQDRHDATITSQSDQPDQPIVAMASAMRMARSTIDMGSRSFMP